MKYIGILAVLFIQCSVGQAAIVTFSASQDATLFEDPARSNGAGEHFFAGNTGPKTLAGTRMRRALIQFDLSSLGAGTTINSVTLTLTQNRTPPGAVTENYGLHRVTSSWTEGAVNAGGAEGEGSTGTNTGASWTQRFTGTNWTTDGGDFVTAASASQSILGNAAYNWSSAGLAADVQQWVNTPGGNFGWLLLGNEAVDRTARRFASRTNNSGAPSLAVDFTAVPEPSSGLLTLIAFGIASFTRRRSS